MTFVKWNQIQTHDCTIHIHMYTYIHNISVSVCVYLNWNHKWGHPPEVTHPHNASHLYSRNNKNYEQWKNFLYLTTNDKFNYKMYIIYCFFFFNSPHCDSAFLYKTNHLHITEKFCSVLWHVSKYLCFFLYIWNFFSYPR